MALVSIVGARPQFIKAGVVSRGLREAGIREILVHTGQHYDENMSRIFFKQLDIPHPAYNLGVGSGGHGEQTGKMLGGIERVLLECQPAWVLVYGDTNSTLAGALAAAKLHIRVAHIEAGLRSYNRMMPEEINRVLTDHVSDLLFVPTDAALQNLQQEGIADSKIKQVGDVMYDAAIYYAEKAQTCSRILHDMSLTKGAYILATVHRAENTDNGDRLQSIVAALTALSHDLPVIWPIHPRTRKLLTGVTRQASVNLRMVDPVGYLDMVNLEKHARIVVTDSGGVQKEAFFYQVPCVTLRNETEWVELVALGWNRLVPPTDAHSIEKGVRSAMTDPKGMQAQPYGDGRSSEKICSILREQLGISK